MRSITQLCVLCALCMCCVRFHFGGYLTPGSREEPGWVGRRDNACMSCCPSIYIEFIRWKTKCEFKKPLLLHASSVCFIDYVCIPECVHPVQGGLWLSPGLVAGSPGNHPHTQLPAPNVARRHDQTHSRHALLVQGLALMKDREGEKQIQVEKV